MSSLNHIFKFGTTALAALVLSACGSSGGGSDAPDVSASTNQTKQSQPSTTANNTTQQPSTTANNTTQQPSTTTSTNNQTASSQSTPAENVAKPSTPNTQSGNTIEHSQINMLVSSYLKKVELFKPHPFLAIQIFMC